MCIIRNYVILKCIHATTQVHVFAVIANTLNSYNQNIL